MYIKYKERCLKFLNGMFAFVIYNTKTKDIFICRDRLGIKPLYISDSDKGLLICSEINAIQNLINSELDNFSIRQYKKLRMTVKGHTVYEKIKMFPAGNYKLTWAGKDRFGRSLPSGVYLYEFKAGDKFHKVKKMTLLK